MLESQVAALIDWTFASRQFDPAWYVAAFPDVAALSMEPETHFRRYGALMGRAPNAALHDDPEQLAALQLAAPAPGRTLINAHEIALTGAHTRAVHFARRHLPPELGHTLHVLQANQALAEENRLGWLAHLNSYLDHFGVAPLLLQGAPNGNVMAQFATAQLPPIQGGPLISVIMPAWNAEKTIGYAVRSILSQTWRNLELLIVDDASVDGTWQIIQSLAASDSRVRTFRNSVNVGPYVSKNVAVTQAKGDWITGHDADDWAHPERLARQVRFCIEQNVPTSLSGMLRIAGDGQFVRLNAVRGFVHDGACRSAFISLMVRARYFHDLLGFWDSVRVGGDSELLRRAESLSTKKTPQLKAVTMLCLDNPEGLTNHSTLGYSETVGVSPHRLDYRICYTGFHERADKLSSRIDFPLSTRSFPAPAELLNKSGKVASLSQDYAVQKVMFRREITVDVALITNLCFSGGNASSSLDELAFLSLQGHSIALVHCPVDNDLGMPLSDRYAEWRDSVIDWSRLGHLSARILICRHPGMLTSHAFKQIASRLTAERAFIVVNNSHLRASGEPVYDRSSLVAEVKKINTRELSFCPISPVIRAELQQQAERLGTMIAFSDTDWTPTFIPSLYQNAPKSHMALPYNIGRHGRDGQEKWHEDARELQKIFPENEDFRVTILGGAKRLRGILARIPSNWTVYEFGSITPYEYLAGLDVFAYYPNTGLVEAFGRTIVEAMLAARPVLLPCSFETTFGDLPIYLKPSQVANAVRALAQNDEGRISWLTEVQNIAVARYSSQVIARRLAGTKLNLPGAEMPVPELSPAALRFKRSIEAVQP